MDTNKIVERIAAMNEKIKEVREQSQSEIRDLLMESLQTVKETYPNLQFVGLTGHTPSFNDGEECTHTHRVYVSNNGGYSDIAEYYECIRGEDFEYNKLPPHIKCINANLNKNDAKKVETLFMGLDDIFEQAFGTDWNIEIDFTGERVTLTHDEYDCGY